MSDARAERLARWRAELEALPERVGAVLDAPLSTLGPPLATPSAVVTTGLGSSEAHARVLAHLLADLGGLPARFVPTGRLHATPPSDRRRTTLVVVSQGLAPNARLALEDPSAWDRVVIATAVVPGQSEVEPGRVRFVEAAIEAGATCVVIPVAPDHGALVRVEGPVLGLAVVWRLARTWLAPCAGEVLALSGDVARDAMRAANLRCLEAFPLDAPIGPFFGRSRSAPAEASAGALQLTTSAGFDELALDLELKLLEGFRLRHVRRSDAIAFTHGPFQAMAGSDASILHLGRAGDPLDADVRARLARMLSPDRHRLKVLEATLPGAAALFEHEQMLGSLLLRWVEETGLDPTRWPGMDADLPLYGWGSDVLPMARDVPPRAEAGRIDVATSPEIEAALAAGRRTLVIALGSTEQHGPHLPLGTDTFIADELARRLVARRSDAWALPALPFGCADEHMAFSGTSSLRASTLEAVLADLLRSAARHGFARAFVFSAHGGNLDALCGMGAALAASDARLKVRVCADPRAVSAAQAGAASTFGVSPEAAGHHAGEWETSVVAALLPGRVRADRLAPGHLASPEEGGSLFYPSLADRVPSGVVGDPSGADPERADAYLDAWVDVLEADLASVFGAASAAPGEPVRREPVGPEPAPE